VHVLVKLLHLFYCSVCTSFGSCPKHCIGTLDTEYGGSSSLRNVSKSQSTRHMFLEDSNLQDTLRANLKSGTVR
jgi:hypothetical protein